MTRERSLQTNWCANRPRVVLSFTSPDAWPEAPRFQENLRATKEEPHCFTDEDLNAMFGMFDASSKGVVTAAQTDEAVRVLTGAGADEALQSNPYRAVSRDEFMELTRNAVRVQMGQAKVPPSRG